jgi:hypothetical protein
MNSASTLTHTIPVLDSAPRSIAIKESASDDAQFASYLEAMNTNVITPRFDKKIHGKHYR